MVMEIRTFQPGDEALQATLYNEAAGSLPKFKPATVQEVKRRTQARDFDPGTRFFAQEDSRVVGYATFSSNGRIGYPWCTKGFEHLAEPLLQHVLQAMKQRGFRRVFTAYRADWPAVLDFFKRHGFRHARDMVNFVLDLVEMPTPSARASSAIVPLRKEDVPAVLALCPEALRVQTADELEQHLFANPYFTPDALFQLRSRSGDAAVAVGVLIDEPTYADPNAVDAGMPCFRLGAFGTETMQTKRIKGLFSFLARKDQNVNALALDLLGHAASRVRDDDDVSTFAAQVPSDVPHLLGFYQRYFRRQGAFPVLECEL
jgi:hypothetical protein